MPFNMFGSVYRNQVFGTFNRQANCQGTPQYCGNPNAQLPGWLQQLEGNCSSRCMACLNAGDFKPTPQWTLLFLIVNTDWQGDTDEQKHFAIFEFLFNNQHYTDHLVFVFPDNILEDPDKVKVQFKVLFTKITETEITFGDHATFTTETTDVLITETATIAANAQASQSAYMQGNKLNTIINNQKKIQRVVGVSESEFVSNLSSAVVSNGSRAPFKNSKFLINFNAGQIFSGIPVGSRPFYGAGTWNQASDRALPAGSRIKKPKTGSSIHVGVGVDVKHNSYARYLARLKGKNLKVKKPSNLQQIIISLNKNKPVVNNKPLPLMIVQQAGKSGNKCACANLK